MEVSVSNQLYVFFIMIAAGAAAGVVFDIFRIIRRVFRTNTLTTSVSDIVFWLLISAGIFFVLFTVNSAQMRWFEGIGIFLGGTVYFLTVSRLFQKTAEAVFGFVVKIFVFILKIVLTPLVFLYRMIKRPLMWIFVKMKRFFGRGGKKTAGLLHAMCRGLSRLRLVMKKS